MVQQDPSAVAAKWAQRLAGSTDAIRSGVMGVTVNPAEKAAARQDAYINGVQQAVASGRWQRGLRRTSLQGWQSAMIDKGLMRIQSGASAGKPKMEKFLGQWLPYQQQLQSKLASMPRGDLNANIARCVAAINHNASFQYQG